MKRILRNLFISILAIVYKRTNYYWKRAQARVSLNSIKDNLKFIGTGVKFKGEVVITYPAEVVIGNNVHIGGGSFFRSEGGLHIDDNVMISRNVTIYTQNHVHNGKTIPIDNTIKKRKVTIHKNVWIGMNVGILPGVTIGEGAIIGLGAIVVKDVEPFAIIGHPLPGVISSRNIDHYQKLELEKKYCGAGGRPLTEGFISSYKKTPNV